MRDIAQLKIDFGLYFEEIKRCIEYECDWALLHILLIMPHICASLENSPSKMKNSESGNQYVAWCNEYFPESTIISGKDRYQMRNTLLHSGSTTTDNRGKENRSEYMHFSFVNRDELGAQIHLSVSAKGKILNLYPLTMAEETIMAVYKWFNVLQNDKKKMENVEKNINKLARNQPKNLHIKNNDGKNVVIYRTTKSST